MAIVRDIKNRQDRMQTAREPYESLMDWTIRLAVPSRELVGRWQQNVGLSNTNTATKLTTSAFQRASLKGGGIWDPTAAASLDTWKNGLLGWHTPSATNWFQQQAQDRKIRGNRNVIGWLQEVDEQMNFALNRSNYYEMKGVRLTDSGGIGPSYMFADEITETGKIRFRVPHPRQLWHELDVWGIVNRMHYRFEKPLREVNRKWGSQALTQSQRTQLAVEGGINEDQEAVLIQAVYKNYDFDRTKANAGKNRPWLSFIVNLDSEDPEGGTLIEQSGFNTINPIPWLLNRSTHELYPRGVVGQFLIEISTSNYMMRDMMMASQQAVRPPLVAFDTLKAKMNQRAGGMTWVDKNDVRGANVSQLVGNLMDQVDWPFGIEMLERFQSVIENRFGVPFFLLMNRLEGGERTATEILQKQAERAVLMTPFLGTLNAITDQELDRVFDIEFSGGRMPPVPEELLISENTQIDIQYTGPLTQLIRQYYQVNKVQGAVQSLAFLLEIDPDVILNMDLDVFAQDLLKTSQAPIDGVVPIEDVKEARLVVAQQREQQQMVENMKNLGMVLPGLDKQLQAGSVGEQLLNA